MIWLLRLFSQFRNLEARYKSQEGVIQATEAREARNGMLLCELEEHLAKANARNAELMDRLDEARKGHIKATETVADFVAQLRYGRKIFDHVPELPDMNKELPQPQRKLKPQASDLVHEAERAFWDGLNGTKAPAA